MKEKKIKKIPQEAEEAEEGNVEAEEEAEDEENEKKKIDLIADFKLASASCMCRLIEGAFSIGLKDISKYPLQLDDWLMIGRGLDEIGVVMKVFGWLGSV